MVGKKLNLDTVDINLKEVDINVQKVEKGE